MTAPISWSTIEAECGGYRAGFVATFEKYKGLPTDERDNSNRVVKVTVASFARHAGIPHKTFERWVKVVADRATTSRSDETEAITARAVKHSAKRAVRDDPPAVVEAIMAAPERTQDAIFDELKLRRAGIDRSTPARKAAKAQVSEVTEQVEKARVPLAVELCILGLTDAAEQLQEALEARALTPEMLARIDEAHARYVTTRHEADFAVEASKGVQA
jgi:hypothetical protein